MDLNRNKTQMLIAPQPNDFLQNNLPVCTTAVVVVYISRVVLSRFHLGRNGYAGGRGKGKEHIAGH